MPSKIRLLTIFSGEQPFEIRSVDAPDHPFRPTPRPAYRRVWLKTAARLADDAGLHRYLLAYASDYAFLSTSLLPARREPIAQRRRSDPRASTTGCGSRRPFRMVDEWLKTLHVIELPGRARLSAGSCAGACSRRTGGSSRRRRRKGLIRKRTR